MKNKLFFITCFVPLMANAEFYPDVQDDFLKAKTNMVSSCINENKQYQGAIIDCIYAGADEVYAKAADKAVQKIASDDEFSSIAVTFKRRYDQCDEFLELPSYLQTYAATCKWEASKDFYKAFSANVN